MVKTNRRTIRLLPIIFLGIAIATIGGVIAYNQSAKYFNNDFQLASEDISYIETFDSPQDWQPCDQTPKTVITTNNSNHPIKVRLKYDEWWRNQADTENLPLEQNGNRLTTINFQNENDWEKVGDWYYWKGELAPGASTNSLFGSVTLDCNANFATSTTCIDDNCDDQQNSYEGANYHINITVQTSDEEFPDDSNTVAVTVNPNGGTYKGSTEPTAENVPVGGSYNIAEISRDGHQFNHWEYADGTQISGNVIQHITSNITIRASWTAATARIERTGEAYPTITDAIAAAQNGDKIILLSDATEDFTNNKTITLDLNDHTVTGSLTNDASGNLVLLNGEINNPNGAAVTNNGVFTMGINDFTATGPDINDNSVRLVGTTSGIVQNGTFNYYDGSIEGATAISGGYNDTPEYDNVKYIPIVTWDDINNVEHVKLGNPSDQSQTIVSKTIVGGDVYYTNLQHNINKSAETGYKIYIVNDFSASYNIEIPTNKTIEIDLAGHIITLNNAITNRGSLTIEDSQTTGEFQAQNTILNNGSFTLNNAKISSSASGSAIQNNATLTLTNSEIANSNGYVMQPVDGATLNIDNNSTLRATGSNAAVYNTTSNFTWANGKIEGSTTGLQNASGASATIKGGTIKGGTYGIYAESGTTVTIGEDDGGTPSVTTPEIIGGSYALYGGSFNFYDGVLRADIEVAPEGAINAKPTNYDLHIESSADYNKNCWLENANSYLEVAGVAYATLNEAYNAITGDTGTIKVIKTTTIDATLPESPTNKNITFDLNGHELTYTQTLINNSNFTITDSSQDQTGKLINLSSNDPTDTTATVIKNNATLTVQSGQIIGSVRAIIANGGTTTNIQGGTIEAPIAVEYIKTNTTNGSTANITNGTIKGESYGIKGISTINMTGGQIIVNSDSSSTATGISSYAVTIDTGKNTTAIQVTNTAGDATGVDALLSNGDVTVLSGDISASGTGYVYGINAISASVKDSTITATDTDNSSATPGSVYGVMTSTTNSKPQNYEDSTIIATGGYYYTYGISSYSNNAVTVKNTTVTASSENGTVYGIYTSGGRYTTLSYIDSNTTSTAATGSIAYGIYDSYVNATIQSGKITSNVYGATTANNGVINIGVNDYQVSSNNPEIIGETQALYTGSYKFYDGVLRGTTAYTSSNITEMAIATTLHNEASAEYAQNVWLEPYENYLEVAGVEYNTLNGAYAAITGDSGTVKVIKDVTIEDVLPNSPSDKSVIFDLNGHTLTYKNPLINAGTMTIIDSSQGKTGRLHYNNTSGYTLSNKSGKTLTIDGAHISSATGVIDNSGNVIIESGLIEGDNSIARQSNSRITVNGGTLRKNSNANVGTAISNSGSAITLNNDAKIESTVASGKKAFITISGGSIYLHNNSSITATINSTSYSYVIENGTVTMDGDSQIIATSNQTLQALSNSTLTVPEGSNPLIRATSTGSSASDVNSSNAIDIQGGRFEAYGSSGAWAFSASGETTIKNTIITVNQSNASKNATGIGTSSGNATIANNTINVSSTGSATGVGGGSCIASTKNLSNNTITVNTTSGIAYGVGVCTNNSTSYADVSININDDIITAKSTSGTSYGVYGTANNVKSGTIEGGTYGVYTITDKTSTLGEKGGTVSTNNPVIIGGSYALSGGNINFYDGTIKGFVDRYNPTSIFSDFETGHMLEFGTETIDNVGYKTAWLTPEHNVARVDSTGVEYTRLSDAINAAANSNDKVYLIADNYITDDYTIPSTKSIFVDMNGYNIYANRTIVNNGQIHFANSQVQTKTSSIDAESPANAFTNAAGSTLGLEDVEVHGRAPIVNNGTVILNNALVGASTGTAINNATSASIVDLTNARVESTGGAAIESAGRVTSTQNNNLSAYTYSIYNTGTLATLESMTIEGTVYVSSGEVGIANSYVTKVGSGSNNYYLLNIQSGGKLILDNTTVFSDADKDINYAAAVSYSINNAGTFSANDSVLTRKPRATETACYVLYNTGTATLIEDQLFINTGNRTSKVLPNAYGIYNLGGTATFAGGSIDYYNGTPDNLTARTNNAYGIYVSSGTVTIGKPEPSDDGVVSTTNPNIKARGNNGYGVFNNNGTVKFYDGKISGKQGAFNKNPNETEQNYVVQTYTDTDNYPYAILEYQP